MVATTTLYIDNVDQTALVIPDTLSLDMQLRKGFGDILSFRVKQVTSTYKVRGGARIDFYLPNTTTPIFSGYVNTTTPMRYAAGAWEYEVECFSAEQLFYRKNIYAIVRNLTLETAVNQILQDPQNGWPNYLATTVVNTGSILNFKVNYYSIEGLFAYEIWDLFADLVNAAWRVNWNSNTSLFELEFYDPTKNYKGLLFSQTSNNFRWNTFEPKFNLKNLVNRQLVIGGKVASTSVTVAYFRGDDLSTRFDLPTTPYNNNPNVLIYDAFDAGTFNTAVWAQIDVSGDLVYVSQNGYAQFGTDGANTTWVGLISSGAQASRALGAMTVFSLVWITAGPTYLGFSDATFLNGYTDLDAGIYIDASGNVFTVSQGVLTATGVTLTASSTSQYRFRITLLAAGGAIFEYQSGANVFTRTWTSLGVSATGTKTGVYTLIATKTAGFTLSSVKTRNPYLGIKLEVDRGSGFNTEDCGVYPADQDMDAVMLNDQVLSFFGSVPGPSTIPPSPDFKRVITSIDTGTDRLTISGGHFYETGAQIVFTTDGTVPGGIVGSQPYYLHAISPTIFTIHVSKAAAIANTGAIDITSTGSGTITVAPGPEYKNIRVTYSEADAIIARYSDNDSINNVITIFAGRLFTVTSLANDIMTCGQAHGIVTGTPVKFYLGDGAVIPTGLNKDVTYYLRSLSSTTFSVYDTAAHAVAGGSTGRTDLTTNGSGSLYCAPTNEDDGVRDGKVIIDNTILDYPVAYAKAQTVVQNGSNLVESLLLKTTWHILTDAAFTSPLDHVPVPGETANYSITLPTTNYTITGRFPIRQVHLIGNKNAGDFTLEITAAYFKRGLLEVLQKLTASGRLISLSEAQPVYRFVSAFDTLVMSDAMGSPQRNYAGLFGDSRYARHFTANAGTDILTITETDTTTPVPISSTHFNFREASGTLADGQTTLNLAVTGAATYNGINGLAVNGESSNKLDASANTYYNMNNFSLAICVEISQSISTFREILSLGLGTSASRPDYDLMVGYDGTNCSITICDGTNITALNVAQALTLGNRYWFILDYTRTGGAANNVLNLGIWAAGNSTALGTATTSVSVLMQQNSNHRLRTKRITGNAAINGVYHALRLWNGTNLSTGQKQQIVTLGPKHPGSFGAWASGDAVKVLNSGGTLSGGLAVDIFYWVNRIDSANFKLYDTAAHGIAGGSTGLIDITSAGSGTQIITPATWKWNHHNWGGFQGA
jgi:hypothetical protein